MTTTTVPNQRSIPLGSEFPTRTLTEELRLYLSLSKPRIGVMVAISTAFGYFLAGGGELPSLHLLVTLIGTVMSCAGSAALNNFLERDSDRLMKRTEDRPLPAGEIAPEQVLAFGLMLVLGGVSLLVWKVNLLTGFLALLTAFLYVLVYTPLKRVTWLNTTIGAVPGALPPMGGWAAATNEIGIGAWIVFTILFLWQHPHFFAIAWMYREDYARAKLQMLPSIDPDGYKTALQMVGFSVVLIPVSLLPVYYGMSGAVYFCGILCLGLLYLQKSAVFMQARSRDAAVAVFKVSLLYVPGLMALIFVDNLFVSML